MLNLVKKDLKLSMKINLFGILYALFISAMGLTMSDYFIANIWFILGMIVFIFLLVIYTNGYDDKSKTEIIINSLPIERKDVVRGKYLALVLFIIFGTGAVLLFTRILPILNFVDSDKHPSLCVAIFAANICLIFYTIYYPFYFKVGEGIRSFNTVLWILVVAGPVIIGKTIKKIDATIYLEKTTSIGIIKLNIFLLILNIFAYCISMQISKKIYLRREF